MFVSESVVFAVQIGTVVPTEQVELNSGNASTEPTISGAVWLIGSATTFEVRLVVGLSTEKFSAVCEAIKAPGRVASSRVLLLNFVARLLPFTRTTALLAKLAPMTPIV